MRFFSYQAPDKMRNAYVHVESDSLLVTSGLLGTLTEYELDQALRDYDCDTVEEVTMIEPVTGKKFGHDAAKMFEPWPLEDDERTGGYVVGMLLPMTHPDALGCGNWTNLQVDLQARKLANALRRLEYAIRRTGLDWREKYAGLDGRHPEDDYDYDETYR